MFQHKVADLPDEPQIPAADLKSRFDACPEELRQSLNAVCDDADRLDARVAGIVAETFGDSIDKSMLSDELQDEIDAKATQTALAAEIEAREQTDAAVAQKCEVYFGTYTGGGQAERLIELDFTPQAVLLADNFGNYVTGGVAQYSGAFALYDTPIWYRDAPVLVLQENGFTVGYLQSYVATNTAEREYHFLAIK